MVRHLGRFYHLAWLQYNSLLCQISQASNSGRSGPWSPKSSSEAKNPLLWLTFYRCNRLVIEASFPDRGRSGAAPARLFCPAAAARFRPIRGRVWRGFSGGLGTLDLRFLFSKGEWRGESRFGKKRTSGGAECGEEKFFFFSVFLPSKFLADR